MNGKKQFYEIITSGTTLTTTTMNVKNVHSHAVKTKLF